MFDHLDDIHSQALSDSKDFILRVDLCMNWGVRAVLLPELHSSHFMGSLIPLMMRLLLKKQMSEVRNVNGGGGVLSWEKEDFVGGGWGGGNGLGDGQRV